MKKLDTLLDRVEVTLCTLFAGIMAVAILIQVINRNTVQIPFSWGEELARYSMVWATFVGVSAGVKKGAHIGVDAVVNILPRTLKRVVQTLCNVLVTGLYLYLTILSVQITLGIRETQQVSAAMQIPMYLIYSGLVVGLLMSTLRAAMICVSDFKSSEHQAAGAGYPAEKEAAL